MSFENDKQRGRVGERLVCRTFAALGYEMADTTEDSDFQEGDIDFVTADGIAYEVKTDYRFADTGNLALESWTSTFGDSWLWTSKADYFAFVCPQHTERFVTISAADLRHIARTEGLKRAVVDDGYKQIEVLLLPYERYKECFEQIDTEVD